MQKAFWVKSLFFESTTRLHQRVTANSRMIYFFWKRFHRMLNMFKLYNLNQWSFGFIDGAGVDIGTVPTN